MIIAIELLLNQYQANAWHHAHCEGVIDWPPSPWRILRAIVAGSYNINLPNQHQQTLKNLLHKMAQVKPSYYLPKSSYIQHRSSRPQVQQDAKIKPGKTLYAAGLLMDKQDSTLFIQYDFELTETEDLVLRLILNGITYLGRKESAAEWTITEIIPQPINAIPDAEGTRIVAVPTSDLEVEQLWTVLNLSAADVFDQDKKAVFPGVEHTTYRIEPTANRLKIRNYPNQIVANTVRLQVIADHKLPMWLAHELCDRLHKSLVKRCPTAVFTGHEHDHTFIQPIANDHMGGRFVEMLCLFTHKGYTSDNLATISAYQWLRVGEQFVELKLVDYSKETDEKSQYWKSSTPMFLTRFPQTLQGKSRFLGKTQYHKDGPEHQALKYLLFLEHLDLSGTPHFEAVRKGLGMFLNGQLVVIANCEVWPDFWKWTSPHTTSQKVSRIGYKVVLEFNQPIKGPIGLGYACHYGLGALRPCL
jgi:CRISPR-associated protein Csb2